MTIASVAALALLNVLLALSLRLMASALSTHLLAWIAVLVQVLALLVLLRLSNLYAKMISVPFGADIFLYLKTAVLLAEYCRFFIGI
jgi:hypothetical protein